jgi:hypothetical protein
LTLTDVLFILLGLFAASYVFAPSGQHIVFKQVLNNWHMLGEAGRTVDRSLTIVPTTADVVIHHPQRYNVSVSVPSLLLPQNQTNLHVASLHELSYRARLLQDGTVDMTSDPNAGAAAAKPRSAASAVLSGLFARNPYAAHLASERTTAADFSSTKLPGSTVDLVGENAGLTMHRSVDLPSKLHGSIRAVSKGHLQGLRAAITNADALPESHRTGLTDRQLAALIRPEYIAVFSDALEVSLFTQELQRAWSADIAAEFPELSGSIMAAEGEEVLPRVERITGHHVRVSPASDALADPTRRRAGLVTVAFTAVRVDGSQTHFFGALSGLDGKLLWRNAIQSPLLPPHVICAPLRLELEEGEECSDDECPLLAYDFLQALAQGSAFQQSDAAHSAKTAGSARMFVARTGLADAFAALQAETEREADAAFDADGVAVDATDGDGLDSTPDTGLFSVLRRGSGFRRALQQTWRRQADAGGLDAALRHLFPNPSEAMRAAESARGNDTLAYLSETHVVLLSLATGEELASYALHPSAMFWNGPVSAHSVPAASSSYSSGGLPRVTFVAENVGVPGEYLAVTGELVATPNYSGDGLDYSVRPLWQRPLLTAGTDRAANVRVTASARGMHPSPASVARPLVYYRTLHALPDLIVVAPNGRLFCLQGDDGSVRWAVDLPVDLSVPAEMRRVVDVSLQRLTRSSVSGDGVRAVVVELAGTVALFDVDSGDQLLVVAKDTPDASARATTGVDAALLPSPSLMAARDEVLPEDMTHSRVFFGSVDGGATQTLFITSGASFADHTDAVDAYQPVLSDASHAAVRYTLASALCCFAFLCISRSLPSAVRKTD